MSDQSPPKSTKLQYEHLTRRGFIASAAGTTAMVGLASSALAQNNEGEPPALESITPQFFSADEWTTIIALTAVLIPSDGDGPGAIETRVPVFIDQQLAGRFGEASDWYMEGPHQPDADPNFGYQTPLNPREIYQQGLQAFDAWCQSEKGGGFSTLSGEDQLAAVTALMGKEVPLAPELRDFPSMLLKNTKEGYFADPQYGGNYKMQAWVYIGFPGARASFLEWATPEKDNVKYPLGPVSIKGERA